MKKKIITLLALCVAWTASCVVFDHGNAPDKAHPCGVWGITCPGGGCCAEGNYCKDYPNGDKMCVYEGTTPAYGKSKTKVVTRQKMPAR